MSKKNTLNQKQLIKLLEQVEYPQRYIGNELFKNNKQWSKVNIAFGFPDPYELGISNLAVRIFYDIFSKMENVNFERFYFPWSDMIELLKKQNIPLFTVDNFHFVRNFDLVGLTFPSELNVINGLKMLELSQIPLLRRDRNKKFPILIAGGPGIANPNVLIPYFDIIFLGEGETGFKEIVKKFEYHGNSEQFFQAIKSIDGVLISKDYQLKQNKYSGKKIYFAHENDFSKNDIIDPILQPLSQLGETRYSIEIMRGCTNGCRFCYAGMMYRPRREKDVNKIYEKIIKAKKYYGIDEVNLLSLSSGDYSQIEPLIKTLDNSNEYLKISLPSLRLDSLSDESINILGKRKMTSLTFALEAGSESLRKVINKKISNETLFNTLKKIKNLSWKRVKFYFMIGLPKETEEDIWAMVNLIREVNKFLGKKFTIGITISIFSPKPHTPFELENFITYEEYEKKISIIKNNLNSKQLHLKLPNYYNSLLETLIARGDYEVSLFIKKLVENDFYNVHWNEFSRKEELEKMIKDFPYERYLFNLKEPFWNNISQLVTPYYIKTEKIRAKNKEEIEDCFDGKCYACGICNKVLKNEKSPPLRTVPDNMLNIKVIKEKKVLFRFAKKGLLKFLSHNDLLYLIVKLLRIAQLKPLFKQGYSRNPKIKSFHALPIGIESEGEYFLVSLAEEPAQEHIEKLRKILPNGLSLINYRIVNNSLKARQLIFEYKGKNIILEEKNGNFPSLIKYMKTHHIKNKNNLLKKDIIFSD